MGVYASTWNIQKIKENIQILQNQNKLQQDQILKLAHLLKFTMAQAGEHQIALYKMDTRLMVLDLLSIIQAVLYLRYIVAVLRGVCTSSSLLTSGILSLKENANALYGYL